MSAKHNTAISAKRNTQSTAAYSVELPVLLEDQNKLITLMVSPAEAERASIDSQYLQQLLNKHYEHSSHQMMKNTEPLPSDLDKCNSSINGASDENEESESSAKTESSSLFIWNTKCVHLLLSLYEEYEDEFNLGAKRRQQIWEKICLEMRQHGYKITWTQCQSKLNGLKRTIKKILDHNNVSGNDRKTWPYFEKMNEIFGSTGWAQPKMLATEAEPSAAADSNTSVEEKTPKKKKLETILDQFNADLRANQQAARAESEANRQEWNNIKAKKFDELMEQKERQHKEKLNMLQLLVESVSKNAHV